MMELLGSYYNMDEIREAVSAQPINEEVPMVQPLVQQCDILKLPLIMSNPLAIM